MVGYKNRERKTEETNRNQEKMADLGSNLSIIVLNINTPIKRQRGQIHNLKLPKKEIPIPRCFHSRVFYQVYVRIKASSTHCFAKHRREGNIFQLILWD